MRASLGWGSLIVETGVGMKFLTSFVVSVFVIISCLQAAEAARYVIGGRDVSESDLIKKHVVKLVDPAGTCTGVIYSERLILTAGHCVFGFDPKTFVAHFGDQPGHAEIKVVDSKTHGSFSWQALDDGLQGVNIGDVALVKLEKDIPSDFSPALMLKDLALLDRFKKLDVAGYGQTVFDDSVPLPDVLQLGKIPIKDIHFDAFKILVNGNKKHNICFGDSGGPAFVEINGDVHVVGILSQFLPRTTNPNEVYNCSQPATYSSIPHYLAWLRKTARTL